MKVENTSYSEVKHLDTTESDRSSLVKATSKQVKKSRKRVASEVGAGEPLPEHTVPESQSPDRSQEVAADNGDE